MGQQNSTANEPIVLRAHSNNLNENKELFEIFFANSEHSLHIQKGLLEANSIYFKTCLNADMMEANQSRLVIEDEDETLLTELLTSLTTNTLTIPNERSAIPMLIIAGKYEITSREQLIIDYLCENMNKTIAIECIQLDIDRDLYKKLLRRASYEIKKEMNTIQYQEPDDMDYMTFSNLLYIIGLHNRPYARKLLISWIKKSTERSEHYTALINICERSKKDGRAVIDTATVPDAVKIDGDKMTCTKSTHQFVFLSDTDTFRAKCHGFDSWAAFGFADKKVVLGRKVWNYGTKGHAFYGFSGNGYRWNGSLKDGPYDPLPQNKFESDKPYTVKYDAVTRIVSIEDSKGEELGSVTVGEESIANLQPCVVMIHTPTVTLVD